MNEKTSFSLQTLVSERDVLQLLPAAGASRWVPLYFPLCSWTSPLAPDGVHGLHILPPLWEERGERSGAQGKGERQKAPTNPVPASLVAPICLSREETNTWFRGAQYFWKQLSVRSGGRPAQVNAATWNLLSLDPAITYMHDVILVFCRTFHILHLTQHQKGFPPSVWSLLLLCLRGTEKRFYLSFNHTGAKVGFKHFF